MTETESEIIKKLLKKIKESFNPKTFPSLITHIRFPYFKNINPNTRIDFTHPLTVFTGANGSGKSSVLHALLGAVKGENIGNYWFSTKVDQISNTFGGERHMYIYGYRYQDKYDAEVLYMMAKREGKPEYWETSDPLQKYGMEKPPEKLERGKYPPIDKKVVYIDFKGSLSAFAKCFYFFSRKGKKVQDYIRKKSIALNKIFSGNQEIIKAPQKGVRQNEAMVTLGDEAIKIIKDIIGKNYVSAKHVRHKIYDTWGDSVLFQFEDSDQNYSDAHAGSGEVAIALAIVKILDAEDGSLILLDEPEISLHPLAQRKFMSFLLKRINENKHQVVMCTHSPTLIEDLPKESIKVFVSDTAKEGKHLVLENVDTREAFMHIGHKDSDKLTIQVEDKASQLLLNKIILSQKTTYSKNQFHVKYAPGGVSAIRELYIRSNLQTEKFYVVLDGDQKPECLTDQCIIKIKEKVTYLHANNNLDELRKLQKDICWSQEIKPLKNSDPNKQIELDFYRDYIFFYLDRVHYLPEKDPETIIFDSEQAKKISDTWASAKGKPWEGSTSKQAKDNISELAKYCSLEGGHSGHKFVFENLLGHWLAKEDNPNQIAIKEIVSKIFKDSSPN